MYRHMGGRDFILAGFPTTSQFLSLEWAGLVPAPESPLIQEHTGPSQNPSFLHTRIGWGLGM